MTPKQLLLAAEMLDLASDAFANHGCNDWPWPWNWTEDERRDFIRAFHAWNGDPEETPNTTNLPDYAVMGFLSHLLRKQAGWDC